MKIRLLSRKSNRPGWGLYPASSSNCYKPYSTSNCLKNNGKNKLDRQDLTLSLEQKNALIGILLADGFLEKRKPNHNARLRIDHTFPSQS